METRTIFVIVERRQSVSDGGAGPDTVNDVQTNLGCFTEDEMPNLICDVLNHEAYAEAWDKTGDAIERELLEDTWEYPFHVVQLMPNDPRAREEWERRYAARGTKSSTGIS
jgi:hypothetical protein